MVFGTSSPCTCLIVGLLIVFRLYPAVGKAASGRESFCILGVRFMLFGTSSPRMRLPGGFFIRFRLHRWFLCFVPATRHCLCLFFLFFFFSLYFWLSFVFWVCSFSASVGSSFGCLWWVWVWVFNGGFYRIWDYSVFEVGMPSGLIWVFNEGFYCIWVSCGSWVLLGVWVLFCGLAGLFLCILPVYLGAPYAF